MPIAGENKIIKVNMKQEDETTPLLLADCDTITAKIVQSGSTYATYTYGTDPEIRQGDNTSQLEVELKASVSAKLRLGKVYLLVTAGIPESEFVVDPRQIDMKPIEIMTIDGL